ncbi:MAG: hypothetical protein WC401_12095 [Bacteroidales bacterium]|jgi:hypothetical protein
MKSIDILNSTKVKDNITAIESYMTSINHGIAMAKNGSEVEDGYILEKLERFANRLGFKLVKI